MGVDMTRHLHVGPGGINCRCCAPPKGSKARKAAFRAAKRREERAALAAQDDEADWRCSCGKLIEEGEAGPHCRDCRWYAEDYEAMMIAEYEHEFWAEAAAEIDRSYLD